MTGIGVQDGILQGFEAFRALAWVRVVILRERGRASQLAPQPAIS